MMHSPRSSAAGLWLAVAWVPVLLVLALLPLSLIPVPGVLLWFMLCCTRHWCTPSVGVLALLAVLLDVGVGVPVGAHAVLLLPACWLWRTLFEARVPGWAAALAAVLLYLVVHGLLVLCLAWPGSWSQAFWLALLVVLWGACLRPRV